MYPKNQHHGFSQPSIKICEAIDCYDSATEDVILTVGKLGKLTLHLCRECAIKKFGVERVE